MADISEIKKSEICQIHDFLQLLNEYGHIFYNDPADLDAPFKKILDGIKDVEDIIQENYGR